MSTPLYLITGAAGGNGGVSRQVIEQLRERGHRARAGTSRRCRAEATPSGTGQVAAVDEDEAAICEADCPPPRCAHDLMLTDAHAVSRAVTEVLHDDSAAFTVGARIHPHRYADSDPAVFGAV